MTPKGAGQVRFKCPHCQKGLLVKDHLAGKRVSCPNCKKPLLVPKPQPAAAPEADVEDLASSLLATAAAAEAAAKPVPKIQMICPFCEEALEFDEALAGKQEPCPKCRNILKVPQAKDSQLRNWRENTRTGPQFAKENIEKKLDGAWDTERGRISAGTLEEAGALPVATTAPVTAATWVRRGFVGVAVVAVLVGGYLGANHLISQSRQKQSLVAAEEAFKKASDKMPRAWKTAYHCALGEFYSHTEEADKAQSELRTAYGAYLGPTGKNIALEEELLLIQVALTEIDIGGTDEQVQDKKRISWDDVLTDLNRILNVIPSQEGQLLGLRRISLKLRQKGESGVALALAQLRSPTNLQASGGSLSPLAAEAIALLLAQKETSKAQKMPPAPTGKEPDLDFAVRLGYAEGLAYQGKFEEARKVALQNGSAPHKLQALLAVAEIAFHTDNAADAKTAYDEAVPLAGEKSAVPSLVMYQLAWLAARLAPDQAQGFVDRVSNSGCKMMAQFEIRQQKSQTDPAALDPQAITDKQSLGFALALEYLGRQRPAEAQAMLENAELIWQPLLELGLALGRQAGR